MSGVDEAQVLEDLVAHLSERLDQADEAVGLRQQVGEVIEQDEHRVDDVSHQEDAGAMHDMLQEVDKTQQRIVETAKALTTTATQPSRASEPKTHSSSTARRRRWTTCPDASGART